MATAEMLDLMTAEEYAKRPDPGYPEELVRGRVVAMTVPDRRHRYVCLQVGRILGVFVQNHVACRCDEQRFGDHHGAQSGLGARSGYRILQF